MCINLFVYTFSLTIVNIIFVPSTESIDQIISMCLARQYIKKVVRIFSIEILSKNFKIILINNIRTSFPVWKPNCNFARVSALVRRSTLALNYAAAANGILLNIVTLNIENYFYKNTFICFYF